MVDVGRGKWTINHAEYDENLVLVLLLVYSHQAYQYYYIRIIKFLLL